MEHFEETINIDEPIESVYSSIADIKNYSNFLPYCESSSVLSTINDITKAKLYFNFHSMRISLTTENINTINKKIEMKLIDGPFEYFNASWYFDRNSSSSTIVRYSMDYVSTNPMISVFLKRNMKSFIDKFLNSFKTQIKND